MILLLPFLSPAQSIRMLTGGKRAASGKGYLARSSLPWAVRTKVILQLLKFLLFGIFIVKHQNLQLWALVALPEQHMLLSEAASVPAGHLGDHCWLHRQWEWLEGSPSLAALPLPRGGMKAGRPTPGLAGRLIGLFQWYSSRQNSLSRLC